MMHALHLNPSYRRDEEYDIVEERITIEGLKRDLLLSPDNSDSWEPIEHKDYYEELNERNLTAAFTGGQNIWYPRLGHVGVSDRNKVGIKEHIISLIKG